MNGAALLFRELDAHAREEGETLGIVAATCTD
jgi:hypothetical protein